MLLLRIATVVLLGYVWPKDQLDERQVIEFRFKYYPVLASLQLRDPAVQSLSFVYIIAIIVYTSYRESSCTGYLPLPGAHSALEQAKLRVVS